MAGAAAAASAAEGEAAAPFVISTAKLKQSADRGQQRVSKGVGGIS